MEFKQKWWCRLEPGGVPTSAGVPSGPSHVPFPASTLGGGFLFLLGWSSSSSLRPLHHYCGERPPRPLPRLFFGVVRVGLLWELLSRCVYVIRQGRSQKYFGGVTRVSQWLTSRGLGETFYFVVILFGRRFKCSSILALSCWGLVCQVTVNMRNSFTHRWFYLDCMQESSKVFLCSVFILTFSIFTILQEVSFLTLVTGKQVHWVHWHLLLILIWDSNI